jgi:hypothetical protein
METNRTNLNTNLTIYANVSDTLQMESVIVNLTYPENTINVNLSMAGNTSAGWHVWNYSFSNISYPLNTTGNYTVGIIARNSHGIQNTSTYITLYVNNTYTLNLTTNYSVYNRGENITIQAWDVNDFRVYNLNLTVNLTKHNQTTNMTNYDNTNYTYQIANNEPEGNYTLFTNISKQSNIGNGTWQFNVSNQLTVSILTSVSSPTLRGVTITVNVSVYNARSTLHNSTLNANISCHNSSYLYTMSLLSFTSSNASFTCYSPTTYSTDFNITVNVTDIHNNTGEAITNLTTESSPSGEIIISGDGGGGGGGGGGGNITIIRNVTVNATVEKRDFNFTAQTTEVQVYRGEDVTIVGAVSNTGNTNLNLSSSIYLNSTCCVISLNPSEFKLNVGGAEIPFTILIHVNTSTEPEKEYFFDIKLKSETLEKSKRIKIIVKENPVISSLQSVSGQVAGIENRIREYAGVGLSIGDLEGMLKKIKETIAGSQARIDRDDINTLKSNENFVKLSLTQINDQLNKLAFIKTVYENKWNIVNGIVIGILSTYLVALVFVPYSRLGLEIRKLKFEEASLTKTRIETEKSYFLRRIDEKTFRTVLSGKQGQIYKITAERKLKEQARSELLRKRMNPLYFGRWIREKISKNKIEKTN